MAWEKLVKNINKFASHVRQDPETWLLTILTAGIFVYGGLLTLSKYREIYNPRK